MYAAWGLNWAHLSSARPQCCSGAVLQQGEFLPLRRQAADAFCSFAWKCLRQSPGLIVAGVQGRFLLLQPVLVRYQLATTSRPATRLRAMKLCGLWRAWHATSRWKTPGPKTPGLKTP